MLDFNHNEGGIGYSAHLAHGLRADDRFDHVLERGIGADHGDDDFGGQSREDVGLDAAAQAIRQDQDGFAAGPEHLDLVSAKFLPLPV